MLFRVAQIFVCALICTVRSVAAPPAPSGDPGIVPADSRLETLWEEGEFTEGVAVAPDGTIYFSDISRDESPGVIYRFDPGSREVTPFCRDSGKSNGLMFNREGELIACCGANYGKMALCRVTSEGTILPLVTHSDGKRLNSPNDLVIHPGGAIYFSDPRYIGPESIELDHMGVYRFDPQDKSLLRVAHQITKPNGLILSPDARTLYVAETNNGSTGANPDEDPAALHRVMTLNSYSIRPDGTLMDRRILVDFGDQLGVDGMTVDVEGHIYCAVRSADRFGIVVFDSDGRELAYIPTPDLPTNCCFGIGVEKSTLYVTAGTGLFRIPLKIAGFHPSRAD